MNYPQSGTAFPGNTNFATYFHDATTGLDYADQRFYTSTYGRFMTADPYRASAGPENPGSWNRYSYTRNDPVNRVDPSGREDSPPDFYATGIGFLDQDYFGGGGHLDAGSVEAVVGIGDQGGGGGGPSLDNLAYSIADALSRRVISGFLDDCQALAGFADSLSAIAPSTQQFISAFQVLTPETAHEEFFNIAYNTRPIFLGGSPGNISGYADLFKDGYGSRDGPNDEDQGHHFAAFVQLGYNSGSLPGSVGALVVERSNFFNNQGNINLGSVAADIGARVKSGTLNASNVGKEIRNAICK